jgi:hypothetical protein
MPAQPPNNTDRTIIDISRRIAALMRLIMSYLSWLDWVLDIDTNRNYRRYEGQLTAGSRHYTAV